MWAGPPGTRDRPGQQCAVSHWCGQSFCRGDLCTEIFTTEQKPTRARVFLGENEGGGRRISCFDGWKAAPQPLQEGSRASLQRNLVWLDLAECGLCTRCCRGLSRASGLAPWGAQVERTSTRPSAFSCTNLPPGYP